MPTSTRGALLRAPTLDGVSTWIKQTRTSSDAMIVKAAWNWRLGRAGRGNSGFFLRLMGWKGTASYAAVKGCVDSPSKRRHPGLGSLVDDVAADAAGDGDRLSVYRRCQGRAQERDDLGHVGRLDDAAEQVHLGHPALDLLLRD